MGWQRLAPPPFTPLPIGLVCFFTQAPDLVLSGMRMGWDLASSFAVCQRLGL